MLFFVSLKFTACLELHSYLLKLSINTVSLDDTLAHYCHPSKGICVFAESREISLCFAEEWKQLLGYYLLWTTWGSFKKVFTFACIKLLFPQNITQTDGAQEWSRCDMTTANCPRRGGKEPFKMISLRNHYVSMVWPNETVWKLGDSLVRRKDYIQYQLPRTTCQLNADKVLASTVNHTWLCDARKGRGMLRCLVASLCCW